MTTKMTVTTSPNGVITTQMSSKALSMGAGWSKTLSEICVIYFAILSYRRGIEFCDPPYKRDVNFCDPLHISFTPINKVTQKPFST